VLVIIQPVRALEDCSGLSGEEKGKCLAKLTTELEGKINESRGQQKTLAATISYLNNRMALTQAQIEQTKNEMEILEDEITILSVKIERLDINLTDVSKLLISRIGATYKRNRLKSYFLFFSSGGFADFFGRIKYLQAVQQNDRSILLELQSTRDTHQQQKDLKQEKQEEMIALQQKLAQQNNVLDQQKTSKQELLRQTQNDEQGYQQLLAAAKAEMRAIQSILAGLGEENKVGNINEGTKIGSIISGRSACSTGTHLHFEVASGRVNVNPASYLKSTDVDWDLCGWWPDCDSPFSFSGSWNWPINGKPRITQGYGNTGYSRTGAYNGGPHTGLDMVASDLSVKTVKTGELYRGSIGCGGGTLFYLKVDHSDSDIDTYYLHVNYF